MQAFARRCAALAALLFVTSSTAGAQGLDDLPRLIQQGLHLDRYTVQTLDVPAEPAQEIAVLFDVDGVDTALVLHPHSMRADAFQLLVERNGIATPVPAPAPRTWRGDVLQLVDDGIDAGSVRASLRDGSLWAHVRLYDGRSFGIQPLSEVVPGAHPSLHVVYDVADVIGGDWRCGVDELAGGDLQQGDKADALGQLAATGLKTCEIALDTDFLFFQKNGSSVTSTVFDAENVLNGVESIYENDVGITYEVTVIVVRTTSGADPYSSTSASTLLNQVVSHWQFTKGAVQRDVTHLLTGRGLSGSTIGVAFLNGICNSQSYGLSESKFSFNFASRVALTAHELGHNWGANHCSGSDCRIMCPGLGGCTGDITKFGNASKNSINNTKNSKGCIVTLQDPVTLPFAETFPNFLIDGGKWNYLNGAGVTSGAQNPPSPTMALNLDAASSAEFADDEIRSNYILAQGASNLIVSYFTQHQGVEAGEELVVEYWNTGLTWKELRRVTSNGTNQTSFTAHQDPLPADGYHNELRIRFRTEVSSGDDDWYVDDVRVDTPALAPPTITTISPTTVEPLASGQVTLDGTGLASATQVKVGAVTLTTGQFSIVNDTRITFTPPAPTVLGGQTVQVVNPLGPSNGKTLTYVAADPPVLVVPVFASNGTPINIDWAGDPFDHAFLVINGTGASFPYGSISLLSPTLFLQVQNNNAAGVGSLSGTTQTVPPGTTFSTQIWLFDQGATDTGSLEATPIKVTQVLF